jgi:hypothetical protein
VADRALALKRPTKACDYALADALVMNKEIRESLPKSKWLGDSAE